MEVYTSYFGNRRLNQDNYTLVNIARSMPKDFNTAFNIDAAKPSAKLLYDYKNNKISWAQYTVRYTSEVSDCLEKIANIIRVYWELYHKPVVLLCWEGPSKHCHRHILADLLSQYYGMGVFEL